MAPFSIATTLKCRGGCYSIPLTLMYKNIISFFSFPSITQNVQMGKAIESQRQLSYIHTGLDDTVLLWNVSAFLLFGLKSLWLYNIPDALTNSHGHLSSILLLTHCMWTCLFLACHPCSFCSISARRKPASCLL